MPSLPHRKTPRRRRVGTSIPPNAWWGTVRGLQRAREDGRRESSGGVNPMQASARAPARGHGNELDVGIKAL